MVFLSVCAPLGTFAGDFTQYSTVERKLLMSQVFTKETTEKVDPDRIHT